MYNACKWDGRIAAEKSDFAYLVSSDRGFGLPPLAKFRTGHLSSNAIHGSQTVLVKDYGDDCDPGSDMDLSSDSETDIQSRQYSVVTSPQDDKLCNYAASINGIPLRSQLNDPCLEIGHSELGSAVGAIRLKQKDSHGGVKLSDSTTSTEVSFGQSTDNSGDLHCREIYMSSDGYFATSTSQSNKENTTNQMKSGEGIENKIHFDTPSAPPCNVCDQEISEFDDHTSSPRAYGTHLSDSKNEPKESEGCYMAHTAQATTKIGISNTSARNAAGLKVTSPSLSVPARLPNCRAIGQGSWGAVISYEACVRLCLHSWAQDHCTEAPYFLNDECRLLRNAFSLRQILLQPEEELLAKPPSGLVNEETAPKSISRLGKIKVQVRKVKMGLDQPTGCSLSCLLQSTIKSESLNAHLSNLKRTVSTEWKAIRKVKVSHHHRTNATGSFSHRSLAYMKASSQYAKQVLAIMKTGAVSLCSSPSPYEVVQEAYSCSLRLKSSSDDEVVKMQPASGETHLFFPNSPGDDLIIKVQNSKGQYYGHVTVQVAAVADDSDEKTQWWPVYQEPEHELVGRMQLCTSYSTSPDDNNSLKCGFVAETVAYDFVLEVAMKVSHFQQRNLLLEGPWKWLLYKFASYYGISNSYTKLRYLSYVMDVATPTEACLSLVQELLQPVIMKQKGRSSLSRQENRILLEIEEQIEKILALVFENYKSLDESSTSGMVAVFRSASGFVAPALTRSVKLYALLHDVLSSEAQLKLCRYLQAAVRKRSKVLLAEVDEIISSSKEGTLMMDAVILSTAYQKMKTVVWNIRNEVLTDIEIHHQNVLPSFIDLPNLSSSIYSVELCNRLRDFLMACPPPCPSLPVTELVIATADFQQDLARWNINPVKGGVDAKELFHSYITFWIQSRRLALLELCKQDKVQPCGGIPEHSTLPFVSDMYDRLKETLNEYDVIVCRWPEYAYSLEQAIADVEKAIFESLERQYSDVLSPLKDNSMPIMFSKYFQKFARQAADTFFIPDELGVLLNTMKRMLDELRPQIERKVKSWTSCMTDEGAVRGEYLNEVSLVLRAKFRSCLHAVVEKLAENTRVQSATKLRKIIQDSKEAMVESEIRSRIQPLKDLLMNTIHHLHPVLEHGVFIAVCRRFWDRMGQDLLHLLENRKENTSSYKGLRIAVSVLDDVFSSEMQRLLGNSLQQKDMEPPTSIMEVRSILCKDAVNF